MSAAASNIAVITPIWSTYTGAEIEHISLEDSRCRLVVRDKKNRLEIAASRNTGALLHAPYERKMIERVAESMTSDVYVRLQSTSDERTLFEGSGEHGCVELQGDIDAILES